MLPVRYSGGLIKRTTGTAFLLRPNSYFESPIKRFTALLLPVAVQFVSLAADPDLGTANAQRVRSKLNPLSLSIEYADNIFTLALAPDFFNIIAAMGGFPDTDKVSHLMSPIFMTSVLSAKPSTALREANKSTTRKNKIFVVCSFLMFIVVIINRLSCTVFTRYCQEEGINPAAGMTADLTSFPRRRESRLPRAGGDRYPPEADSGMTLIVSVALNGLFLQVQWTRVQIPSGKFG